MVEIALGVSVAAFFLSVLALAKLKPPKQEQHSNDECAHIWSPWEHVQFRKVYAEGRALPDYQYDVQKRQCLNCGLTGWKKDRV